jgi:hypothetical protein
MIADRKEPQQDDVCKSTEIASRAVWSQKRRVGALRSQSFCETTQHFASISHAVPLECARILAPLLANSSQANAFAQTASTLQPFNGSPGLAD